MQERKWDREVKSKSPNDQPRLSASLLEDPRNQNLPVFLLPSHTNALLEELRRSQPAGFDHMPRFLNYSHFERS